MWSDKQPVISPSAQKSSESLRTATPLATSEVRRNADTAYSGGAWLGPELILKGELSGTEDLFIESTVEGPISFGGHRVTVGRNGKITGEVVAREVVVFGRIQGDLRAHDRVEIKKDGALFGDLETARVVIEDGAFLKGNIEIDRDANPIGTDLAGLLNRSVPVAD